jgi:outer membrane protein OmpA-like peptidoglycan-associated protein
MSLMELTRRALSPELSRQVAGAIQQPPETARSAMESAVPAIFAGLTSQASTSGGAAKVFAAITEGGRSEGLLERVFDAHQVVAMSEALAARVGISKGAATRVLSAVTPVAGAVIGKEIVGRRLGPTGLADMLGAPRARVQPAPGEPTVDAISSEADRSRPAPPPRRATRPRWGLLVFGLIAVAVALAVGVSSRSRPTDRIGATAPQATPPPQQSAQEPKSSAPEPAPTGGAGAYAKSITFVDATTTTTPESNKAIDDLADALKGDPTARIRLTAYVTDAVPASARSLAESRSVSVKKGLEERGIYGGRIETAVSDAPPGGAADAAEGSVGVEVISR